jgi:hypothetical protein
MDYERPILACLICAPLALRGRADERAGDPLHRGRIDANLRQRMSMRSFVRVAEKPQNWAAYRRLARLCVTAAFETGYSVLSPGSGFQREMLAHHLNRGERAETRADGPRR